ncbi:UDP-4-amino-4,6-dideoxy-N-acetyl-beta-L-altrosami ne transaminase [Endothiovibrio diazotrophicus]
MTGELERAPAFIPYGRQWVDEADVVAVSEVLRSDWLTTGPMVGRFENAFAAVAGSAHAVALANGTAALHAMVAALGIGPGDEVIVPAMTFAATANCALFQGATPRFADVDPATLLLDPAAVEALVTPSTRAVIAVDYAGQPCDYPALEAIAERHGIELLADACHSLGGALAGRPVGSLARMSAFSLHPVKPITAGEGGVVTTDDDVLAEAVRRFRNHGIATDHRAREALGTWSYAVETLGYNYRLSDIHCALGLSQLGRLAAWTERRREIAERYDRAFAELTALAPLARRVGAGSAWHLYVVQLAEGADRKGVFEALRRWGIGVNVHYIPLHLHPYYRERLGVEPGLCPVAERAYERILSLPIFPAMGEDEVSRVIAAVIDAMERFA